MTLARAQLQRQLARLADELTPEMTRAFTAALKALGDAAVTPGVLRALAQRNVLAAVEAMLASPPFLQATLGLRRTLTQTFIAAGERQIRTIVAPHILRAPFTVGDPRAIARLGDAITDLARLLPSRVEHAGGFVAAVREGLAKGWGPLRTAEHAAPFVPLTAHDHALWMRYEVALRAGDVRGALASPLRDTRMDGVLRVLDGSRVPERTIAKLREGYLANLSALRAETLARTATLNASRLANYAGWQEVAWGSGVPETQMWKTWHTTQDGRQRDAHNAMHGVTVRFDQPWPVDGGVLVPGLNTYNCRCHFTVHVGKRPP